MNKDLEEQQLKTKLKRLVQNGVVEARLLGERIKFGLQGRPDPTKAILLVGSGRSGTTWLQEVLANSPGTQCVFEPLHPMWSIDLKQLTGWPEEAFGVVSTYSYYLRPDEKSVAWHRFWSDMLQGKIRSWFTDSRRYSFFPDRYLFKMIRANLMLGYLYDQFQPRMIFIIRHPCATIASRLHAIQNDNRIGWSSDTALLLAQKELVADYLAPWVDEIAAEERLIGKLAIWWAVENLVALDQLKGRPHYFLSFESLCVRPEQELAQIEKWLNDPTIQLLDEDLNKPSRTSFREYDSVRDRLTHWQTKLTVEEQAIIFEWVTKLGVPLYNEHPLPLLLQEEIDWEQVK